MGRAGTGGATGPSDTLPGRGRQDPRRLLDSPAAVGAVTGAAALVFVVGRLVVAAHGNVGAFVVGGRLYADPGRLGSAVPVHAGSGYDGQFYYRLALDPLQLAPRAFGIRLDSTSRLGRPGYPALAWLLSGGRHSLTPVALVAVNVLGLAALGAGGASLARSSGRRAVWGLVFPAYFGYLWSLGRDLTEISAAAFLLLGVAAYRRRHLAVAALALAAAVLCKETSAYVVVAFGLTRLAPAAGRRQWSGLGREDLVWAAPLVAFLGWQAVVVAVAGRAPILASGSANLGPPLVGLVDGARHYLAHPLGDGSLLWSAELAVLAIVTAAASLSLRATTAPLRERVAWGGVVVLALCAASGIWLGEVGFRSLDTVYLFDWIVLLGSPRRLRPLALLSAAAWLAVAVELVLFV